MTLSVREMINADIENVVSYFVNADEAFLSGMGADKSKLPQKESWIINLEAEVAKPYNEKSYFYIIWCLDDQPIGHSNVNHIKFGESATMHLHIWNKDIRRGGFGHSFLLKTIPIYFQKLEIKKLICEPFADNEAPNKTLRKLGFTFIRTYHTTPGLINFRQQVSRYELVNPDPGS